MPEADLARTLLNRGTVRSFLLQSSRSKATWGSRIATGARPALRLLVASVVLLLWLAAPTSAAPGKGGKGRNGQHSSKLDDHLEERAGQTTGDSDVIVEFNKDRGAREIIRAFGKDGRRLRILNGYTAKIPNHLLRQLAEHGFIKKVSLDREAYTLNGRTAITTGARAVQELSGYTGAGIGVAVVDSGVAYHRDLTKETGSGQRVTHFVDFVDDETMAYDDFGHGTHVAGTIGGNGLASAGLRKAMAPGASIIALKALDDQGLGQISDIIAAIDYAVAIKDVYNIRVINLSLGAGVYESYHTDPLTLAAKRAVEAGIVVVAAAGNLGQARDGTPQYGAVHAPANAPWVLTVGASSTQGTTDRADDIVANYSSRGPTIHDYAAKPDLVAPGTGTVSLSARESELYRSKPHLLLPGADDESDSEYLPYLSLSGTSMAAPVVSGTVALMLEANPNLTPNLVKAILQFTSQIYSGYNWLTQGAGFLNTRAAVQLAEYFATSPRGTPYPDMTGWSRHIFWGNYRVSGGVLTPGGTAWGTNVVWGNMQASLGQNIVWGENCLDPSCDNVVWGNSLVWGPSFGPDNIVWGNTDLDNVVWGNGFLDNIVWGNGFIDNVVWGNSVLDNVVWGNDCAALNCDNVVWGNTGLDNIVWGNCDGLGCDNVVWGNAATPADVAWGDCMGGDSCDNIVWGNSDGDNVVWGNSADALVFGDDGADVRAFDPAIWDNLFKVTALSPSAGIR